MKSQKSALVIMSAVVIASGASAIELNSSESLKYYGQGTQDFRVSPSGNVLVDDGTLNITNGGEAVANFTGTGIDLYKPLSVRSSGPLSVANGVELTGTGSNTIESFSTFYLTTSSGSASDIVLDPTGQVGVDSNLETTGNISIGGNQLDLENGDIDNANNIQTGSVSDSDADNEINFNSNRLTGLKDPNGAQDAATQSYVNTNDDTIQDNQGLEEVLSLDNRVGGQNINFNQASNIQAQGTNAITLDNNQNIGIPNGGLEVNGNLGMNSNNVNNVKNLRLSNTIGWTDGNPYISNDGGGNTLKFFGGNGYSFDTSNGDYFFRDSGSKAFVINRDGYISNYHGRFRMRGNNITELGGINDASAGAVRLANGRSINWRSSEGDADFGITGTSAEAVDIRGTSGSDIAAFKQGGNVAIPNGNLQLSESSTIEASNHEISFPTQHLLEISAAKSTVRGELVLRGGRSGESPNSLIRLSGRESGPQGNKIQLLASDGVVIDGGNLNLSRNALSEVNTIRFSGNPQIGQGSDAASAATAIGQNSEAGLRATALGDGSSATGKSSTAIGQNSAAAAKNAIAIGHISKATQNKATAIGQNSQATKKRSTAIGQNSQATAEGAVAIGDRANAPNTYEATFGNLNGQRLDANVTGKLTVHQDTDLNSNDLNNIGTSNVDAVYDGGDDRVEVRSNGEEDICIGNCGA